MQLSLSTQHNECVGDATLIINTAQSMCGWCNSQYWQGTINVWVVQLCHTVQNTISVWVMQLCHIQQSTISVCVMQLCHIQQCIPCLDDATLIIINKAQSVFVWCNSVIFSCVFHVWMMQLCHIQQSIISVWVMQLCHIWQSVFSVWVMHLHHYQPSTISVWVMQLCCSWLSEWKMAQISSKWTKHACKLRCWVVKAYKHHNSNEAFHITSPYFCSHKESQ